MSKELIPGTAVAIDGRAILLSGKSGSGKSDLALRLIDRGAVLISDDMVAISQSDSRIWLSPAPNIDGKLEIRNIGIVDFPCTEAPLAMLITTDAEGERYPLEQETGEIAKQHFPKFAINPLEASAPVKIEVALRRILENEAQYV